MRTIATAPRVEVFALPWPPSANTSKIPVRGRMVSTPKLRAYHTACVLHLGTLDIPPMLPPYEVTLEFHEPDRRRRDVANLEKAVCDSIVKAGIMEDDCKINKLTLVRMPEKFKDGRVVVTITEVSA